MNYHKRIINDNIAMRKLESDSIVNSGELMRNLLAPVCTNYEEFSYSRENYGCCSLDLIQEVLSVFQKVFSDHLE